MRLSLLEGKLKSLVDNNSRKVRKSLLIGSIVILYRMIQRVSLLAMGLSAKMKVMMRSRKEEFMKINTRKIRKKRRV